MKNKNIAISNKLWVKLSKAKINWGFSNFDSLISWILRSYESKLKEKE